MKFDCCEWVDSSRYYLLLTITAAVINIFFIYGYILPMVLNIFSHEMTVMYLYDMVWCLCQDKPYGTIILETIPFRAYNNNCQFWSLISFYIWTLTKILSKHRSMFWKLCCFDIVIIIFFRVFLCYIMYDWVQFILQLYPTHFFYNITSIFFTHYLKYFISGKFYFLRSTLTLVLLCGISQRNLLVTLTELQL